jgi:hypothetical protein
MDVWLLRTSLVDTGTAFLNAEGRRIVRALGNKLKMADEPSFDRVVTGTEPATVQTAELFADRTDYVGVIESLPILDAAAKTPGEIVVKLLLERGSSIVVVADEPILATVGAFLVGRPTFPPAVASQVSFVRDRKPEWFLRPGEIGRQVLLVA